MTTTASRPVRVLIDASILRRPPTGIARWLNGLTEALGRQAGLQLISSQGPARITLIRQPDGRPGVGAWLNRIPNVSRQRWWYEAGIHRLARREHADVLLMPSNLSARPGRLPQVVVIHDVNFLTAPGTYEPAAARYLTWSFRRAVRDADAIITDSEFSRSEICRHLRADPARVRVVYPGLADPVAPAGPDAPIDGPYALWVGATEVNKNLDLLMDVWAEGSPGGLTLAIVGHPGRDHANLVARSSRLDGRVVVTGAVSEAELERWYRHALVFLFSSKTEGFGFPPLEAMLRGVPVVAASAGSLPEVLGDAALYHALDDPLGVREAVERLLGDDALRRVQVERGLDRAAGYRWERTAAQVEGILREVVDRRSGR